MPIYSVHANILFQLNGRYVLEAGKTSLYASRYFRFLWRENRLSCSASKNSCGGTKTTTLIVRCLPLAVAWIAACLLYRLLFSALKKLWMCLNKRGNMSPYVSPPPPAPLPPHYLVWTLLVWVCSTNPIKSPKTRLPSSCSRLLTSSFILVVSFTRPS